MTTPQPLIEVATDWLKHAVARVDGDVVLASPFLSFDVCRWLADAARHSGFAWRLATKLDPGAVARGVLAPEGVAHLIDAGVEVHDVARLHAKCFVVGSRGMLGSANLTGAGLGSSTAPNRELGTELGLRQVEQARTLMRGWPSTIVTRARLDILVEEARSLTRDTARRQAGRLEGDSAPHLAAMLLLDARERNRSLWLKLEYGSPELDGWRKDWWFASPRRGRPTIRPGDLVVICAQSTHDCYAVVEVTSDPEWQPADYVTWTAANDPPALDRWPWVSRTLPRFVPSTLLEVKLPELGVVGQSLQNGHVRLRFDQFTAAIHGLQRLATA